MSRLLPDSLDFPHFPSSKFRADDCGTPDVLDRLRWDPSLKIDQYVVGYLDRFGGVQELAVLGWIKESTDEEWIPQHRIRYFRRLGERGEGDLSGEGERREGIVWDRDERIDLIFGSGGL